MDGLYCYAVMPYGLKNALPTFVRAMSKTFEDLIRDKVNVTPGFQGSKAQART
jgi:hypothetical protein